MIYLPWATNLLPHEIEKNIVNIDDIIKIQEQSKKASKPKKQK